MRVISGSARGTKLKTLSGDDIIRPTTDRVKESLFNILQFSIYDSVVLDIFCGSGSLGIEALSRGAESCDFVDSNLQSLKIAEHNIKATHLESKSNLVKSDYQSFLASTTKKYDIIFADPPYAAGFLKNLLKSISESKNLADDGIIAFETSSDVDGISSVDNIELYRTAVYGNTKILFYRHRSWKSWK